MTRSRKRKLLMAALALLAAWIGLNIAAPYILKNERVKRALSARLASALGRPVEVGRFDVSLIGGPRLEAESVSVGEDPRFGYEYFLRAERLTAGLRWRALLRLRLEFGTLQLARPSFNVVQSADGGWNLRSWMPATRASSAPGGAAAGAGVASLVRVEFDGGRINFKRGVDKHPLALIAVEGFVERNDDGAWRIDLQAMPMRAGVAAQQPGILEVRGVVQSAQPGSSPADVSVQWADASVSDALRLVIGHDYGMRGNASLQAQIGWPGSWPPGQILSAPTAVGTLRMEARLTNVHRWDLPARAADPAVNLRVDGNWRWPFSLVVSNGLLEAPGSNVRFSGNLSAGAPQPPASLRVISSAISLNDLFSWYRAFRPGVSEAITVEGHSGVDLEIRGWPPRVERAVMATGGGAMRVAGAAAGGEPLSFGPAELRFTRDARARSSRIELRPVMLSFGDPRRESVASSVRTGTLRVDGFVAPSANWRAEWNLAGQTARAERWWAAAAALGVPHLAAWAANGWGVEGPAAIRMHWRGTAWPAALEAGGTLDVSGGTLRGAFLNQPVRLGVARVELGPGERRVTFNNAQLFGGAWSGTLRSRVGQPWEVALTTERLDAAQTEHWLNPAARQGAPGILQRFAGSTGSTAELPAGLRATGRLNVAQFTLGRLTLRRLRGALKLETGAAWSVTLADAQADFFGGAAQGSFTAQFDTAARQPAYKADVNLNKVSLPALAAASARTAGLFDGQLGGRVSISAAGIGRDALLQSLQISGQVQLQRPRYLAMDLAASLRAGEMRRGTSEFTSASGEFGLDAERRLQIASLRLTLPAGRAPVLSTIGASATIPLGDERPLAVNQVDVSGNLEWFAVPETRLNLDIFVPNPVRSELAVNGTQGRGRGGVFHLRGTLAAPQFTAGTGAAGKQ